MLKTMLISCCLATGALAADDEAPVALKFKVTSGKVSEVLMAGNVAVVPGRAPAMVERQAGRGPERQSFVLELQQLDEGKLLVRVHWSDTSSEGESVKWEPSFVVRRSAEARVRLDFPGGVRLLELSAG